jgi:hypothetical protein
MSAAGGETQEASFLLALAKEPARCRRYKGNTAGTRLAAVEPSIAFGHGPVEPIGICDMPCPTEEVYW